jgi:hypothetical protein
MKTISGGIWQIISRRSENFYTMQICPILDNNNHNNNNREFITRRLQNRTAAHDNIRVHTLRLKS